MFDFCPQSDACCSLRQWREVGFSYRPSGVCRQSLWRNSTPILLFIFITTPVLAGPPISDDRVDRVDHGIEQIVGYLAAGASQSPSIRGMIKRDAQSFDPRVTIDAIRHLGVQVWLDGEPVDVLILTHGIEWRAAWRAVRDDRSPLNVLRLAEATVRWGVAWWNVVRVNERLFAFLDDSRLSEGSIQYRYVLPNGIVRESFIQDNRLSLTTTVPAPSRMISWAVLRNNAVETNGETRIYSSLHVGTRFGDFCCVDWIRCIVHKAVRKRGPAEVGKFLGQIASKARALGEDGKRMTDSVKFAIDELKAGRLDRIVGRIAGRRRR